MMGLSMGPCLPVSDIANVSETVEGMCFLWTWREILCSCDQWHIWLLASRAGHWRIIASSVPILLAACPQLSIIGPSFCVLCVGSELIRLRVSFPSLNCIA